MFLTVNTVFSNPFYSTDIKDAGFGVVEINSDITIYKNPDINSEELITLYVREPEANVIIMDAPPTSSYYFLARNKEKNKAYLVVTDEEDDWLRVCYSQKEKLYGWVHLPKESVKSWRSFYMLWGQKKGV